MHCENTLWTNPNEKAVISPLWLRRNHFCALRCSCCVSLLVETIFFYFQGNMAFQVEEMQKLQWEKYSWKSQRNALACVKKIQLRMIFAVSSVTLCQPSYWGNPPSQFCGKPKLLPRWKARKDFPRNHNLVLITPINIPIYMYDENGTSFKLILYVYSLHSDMSDIQCLFRWIQNHVQWKRFQTNLTCLKFKKGGKVANKSDMSTLRFVRYPMSWPPIIPPLVWIQHYNVKIRF